LAGEVFDIDGRSYLLGNPAQYRLVIIFTAPKKMVDPWLHTQIIKQKKIKHYSQNKRQLYPIAIMKP